MWGVVLLTGSKRQIKRGFPTRDAARDYEDKCQKLKERIPKLKTCVISLREAIPVDNTKKKNINQIWCPYCGTWRHFKYNDSGYKCCEMCGVSDAEYYVKKLNHLWE